MNDAQIKHEVAAIVARIKKLPSYVEFGDKGLPSIVTAAIQKAGMNWAFDACTVLDRMEEVFEDGDERASDDLFDEAVPEQKLMRDMFALMDERQRRYVAYESCKNSVISYSSDYHSRCIEESVKIASFVYGLEKAGYETCSRELLVLLLADLMTREANNNALFRTQRQHITDALSEKENQDEQTQ